MKLAFSTLGCPRWSFNDMFSTGKDLGFDGVEIRGVANQMYAPLIDVFSGDKILSTINKLRAGNFSIPILSSAACIAVADGIEHSMKEADDYLHLASRLGVPYIRVMCTNSPAPDGGDFDLATKNYKILCKNGEKLGVCPLIETNGIFSNSDILLKFLKAVGEVNCGVLWDIHHTCRYNNEKPSDTWAKLSKFIKHIHIKDSIVRDGVVQYKMLGYGDMPIKAALDLLKAKKFEGYASLEWVKRWKSDLEEPGIVFAHFIQYMAKYKS